MLKDLRRYEHFGNPEFFFDVLKLLKNHQNSLITKTQLNRFFYNRNIDNKSNFQGAIELAIRIGILAEKDEVITIHSNFLKLYTERDTLQALILELFFKKINCYEISFEIFNDNNISYSYETNEIIIKNQAFKFKFSNVKNFLIDFNFLICSKVNNDRYYLINHNYFKFLNPSIFSDISRKRRKISVSDFEKNIALKKRYGYEAESFIYAYENKRLLNNKLLDWTALHTVNEGYDIASYNNLEDSDYNRFIEVKSYEGDNPYFYLSENEYKIAVELGGCYWLYLVNRKYMHEPDYHPMMIQNPSENIFSNSYWSKNEEKTYKFSSRKIST